MRQIRTFLRALVAGCSLAAVSHTMAQEHCSHATTLSPIPDYVLSFQICGSTLYGSVTTRGSGWAAFGFGRDQFMPETDVFMAGVGNGLAYSQDAFALQRAAPRRDASQDVTLLSATEAAGVTRIGFSRPLTTGDAFGDFDLSQGPYYVLMAYQANSDNLAVRHSWSDASDHAFLFAPVPEPESAWLLLIGLGVLMRQARGSRSLREG